jgi:hypothetical protein
MNSIIASVFVAMSLLVAPAKGATGSGVSTSIGTSLPTPAVPAPQPQVGPKPNPSDVALKAEASLLRETAKLVDGYTRVAGCPGQLIGVSLSQRTGLALATIGCPSKNRSLTVLLGYTPEDDTWTGLDMFVPVILPPAGK